MDRGRTEAIWKTVALLVLGTLGVSHGLDGLLELSGLRERSALAEFDAALAEAGGKAFWLALLCIGLALDALRRPEPSTRMMGEEARLRARPWLVAVSVALLLASLLVIAVLA